MKQGQHHSVQIQKKENSTKSHGFSMSLVVLSARGELGALTSVFPTPELCSALFPTFYPPDFLHAATEYKPPLKCSDFQVCPSTFCPAHLGSPLAAGLALRGSSWRDGAAALLIEPYLLSQLKCQSFNVFISSPKEFIAVIN